MKTPLTFVLQFWLTRIVMLAAVVLLPLARDCFAQTPVIQFVRDPDSAPAFQLKDLDGKDLSLESSKGKVVLLNFWATWCGPCRQEIPGLVELQERYKDRLQIIGLVVDDDDEKAVRKVVETSRINYPVALVDDQTRYSYGGIAALPTVFLINADGRVVQKHVGLYNPALYEVEVRALLGMPVAVKVETFVDEGDIFLKHADRAKILPGVDMTNLTPEQRGAALHQFNAESCNCGCNYTLAQCRIYDPGCQISQKRTTEIVKKINPKAGENPPLIMAPQPDGATPSAQPESPKP